MSGIGRREFLGLGTVAGAGLAAGCAPGSTTAVILLAMRENAADTPAA